MAIKIVTKPDIHKLFKKLDIDFSDFKEVKFLNKIREEESNIIERAKGLNCLKELFIDYKKKKEAK